MRKSYRFLYLLYVLAFIGIFWLIFTFLYQYLAAIGSIREVISALQENRILSALWLSILSSIATAFLSVLFGIPIAYLLVLRDFRGKSLIESLTVDVPQTFPPVAEGMIYFLMLGPSSPFNINLAYTFTALIIAKIYICMPFIISFTARRFREIRETGMNMTARSLGANRFQVFALIFLPLSARDILAGSSLCWSRAMGELGGSLIFAGVIAYKTEIIPTFIATQAQYLTTASLTATILVTTASMMALVTFKMLTNR